MVTVMIPVRHCSPSPTKATFKISTNGGDTSDIRLSSFPHEPSMLDEVHSPLKNKSVCDGNVTYDKQRDEVLKFGLSGTMTPFVLCTLAKALDRGSPGFSTENVHDKHSGVLVSLVTMRMNPSAGVVVGAGVPRVVDVVAGALLVVVAAVEVVEPVSAEHVTSCVYSTWLSSVTVMIPLTDLAPGGPTTATLMSDTSGGKAFEGKLNSLPQEPSMTCASQRPEKKMSVCGGNSTNDWHSSE